ncbi:hypothetical protein ABFV71_11730 [Staphylococcus saprophyticus]
MFQYKHESEISIDVSGSFLYGWIFAVRANSEVFKRVDVWFIM